MLLDKAIAACADDDVEEIRSLGHISGLVAGRDPHLPRHWRVQRPDRWPEPLVETVERSGDGFESFKGGYAVRSAGASLMVSLPPGRA